jgi:hypothetical protein
MKTWVKVLLGGCLLLLVLGFVAVFVAVRWFQSNKDDLQAKAAAVRAEGQAFGRSATASACVAKAIENYRGDASLWREVRARVWLPGCLETATPESELCAGVPPRSEIMRTVTWRMTECSRRGLDGDRGCTRILDELQKHCEKRASRAR